MCYETANLPIGWPTVESDDEEFGLVEFDLHAEDAPPDGARVPTKLEERLEKMRKVKPPTAQITAADFQFQGTRHRSENIDDTDEEDDDEDDADWLLDLDVLSSATAAVHSPRSFVPSFRCRRLWYWIISIFRCFSR